MSAVRWSRIAGFYGVTLLLTCASTFAWRAAGRNWQEPAAGLFLNLCMLIPGLVALGFQRWILHEPLGALGIRKPPWSWLVVAWLLAPLLMLLALAVALSGPSVHFNTDFSGLAAVGVPPEQIAALRARLGASATTAVTGLLLQGLLLGPTVFAIGGLGEELAWRGFLHHELSPLAGWRRTAMIGLLWGVWHLPAVLQGYAYPHHPWLGSLVLLVLTQQLAVIYSWLRERSQSVFAPAVFHGTCSATSAITIAFVTNGNELTTGFTSLAGVVAAAGVSLLLPLFRRSE